jgi:hypothetical protein
VAFSPNGRTVAAAFYIKDCIKLYDTATGQEQASLKVFLGTYPTALALSPDGRLLAVNSEGNRVRLLLIGAQRRSSFYSCNPAWAKKD